MDSINVVTVSVNDLKSIVYDFTRMALSDHENERSKQTNCSTTESKEKAPIRGIHGLAKFLGVSPVTAQALKNSGKIPYSQYGRVVLFDGDKVLSAMEPNKKRR